ncbi:MAG: hypothetical protein KDE50_25100 [Caldilineaceae bacterium]|nr:hypothetical protein [Caldilineaceae bacterium]MCB0143201.1 hypothetical protein [Caldilineaceae bacterium]
MKGCLKIIMYVFLGLVALVVVAGLLRNSDPNPSSERQTESNTSGIVSTSSLEQADSESTQLLPTDTSTPTSEPTATPIPTATPEPIVIKGTGDSIQDFSKWLGPAIVHVVGNPSQRHFAVIPYDSNGNRTNSIVNTTDYYDGTNLLDFEQNEQTTRLEIKSEGDWAIEILPLANARTIEIPGTIEGNGDEVLLLIGNSPDIANISGNASARHFAVITYGNGRRLGSIVNTTEPYEGQVLIDRRAEVLQVTAEGGWSISIAAAQ